MKAFGYVRVSIESENPENQVRAIEEFAKNNDIEILKVFKDVGVSGGEPALERPEFLKMVGIAEELGVKTIIVFDLTRLGRDLFDVIKTMQYLMERGFNVLFVKHSELNVMSEENSYVAQTMRKALLALLATFAEMERSFIRERTRQGIRRAREQGKHVGRPPYLFPVDKVKALLAQGKSIADTWRLLKETGEICREVRNGKKEDCMKYETFRRKIKILKNTE